MAQSDTKLPALADFRVRAVSTLYNNERIVISPKLAWANCDSG